MDEYYIPILNSYCFFFKSFSQCFEIFIKDKTYHMHDFIFQMKNFMLGVGYIFVWRGMYSQMQKESTFGYILWREVSQLTPIYIHITLHFSLSLHTLPIVYIYLTHIYIQTLISTYYTYILYDVAYITHRFESDAGC